MQIIIFINISNKRILLSYQVEIYIYILFSGSAILADQKNHRGSNTSRDLYTNKVVIFVQKPLLSYNSFILEHKI